MTKHSKETIEVVRAAMALAQRDVDLGLATLAEIQAIPRTRFAPVERKQAVKLLKAEGKSDREVAKRLGVDKGTVARDQGKSNRRVGAKHPKNGGKAPTSKRDAEDAAAKNEYDKTTFLHRADLAASYAVYTGKVDKETCRAARAAALAWDELATEMENV